MTGWTFEQLYEQPMREVLELVDHWNLNPPPDVSLRALAGFRTRRKKPKVKGDYEHGKEGRAAGVLPSIKNTATDETSLPDWVRQVRQMERARKMAAQIEAKQKA